MRLRRKLLIILGAAIFTTVFAAYAAAQIIPDQGDTQEATQSENPASTLFIVFAIITAAIYAAVYFLIDRLVLSAARPLPDAPQKAAGTSAPVEEVEALRQRLQALTQSDRESRIRLNAMLDYVPVVLLSMDAQGIILSAEGMGLEYTSLESDSVVGKSIFELYPDNTEISRSMSRVLKGENFSDTLHIDSQIWDVWHVPNLDPDGRVSGAVMVGIDVTEHLRFEGELRKAKDAAEAANIAKTTFLANMSHELRTPLNAIIGFIGVIQMNPSLSDKDTHRLERVLVNGHRLLELIDDILDLSRIEAGRMAFAPSNIRVRDTVALMQKRLQDRAEKKNLIFATTVTPQVPDIICIDEDAVQKIMTHLLTNAIKFTPQGRVDFTVDFDHDHLVITVKDTGIGIPAHMHDVIFQSFRQVDESSTREYGGTGLGLAIVYQLCLAMGGTVNLESKVNEGSLFTVKLPVEERV